MSKFNHALLVVLVTLRPAIIMPRGYWCQFVREMRIVYAVPARHPALASLQGTGSCLKIINRKGVKTGQQLQVCTQDLTYFTWMGLYCNNISLRVYQEGSWNGMHIKQLCQFPIKLPEIWMVIGPVHLIPFDGSFPAVFVGFDANAYNLKSFFMVHLIQFNEMRVFSATWWAPGSPKMDEDIFPVQVAAVELLSICELHAEFRGFFSGWIPRLAVPPPPDAKQDCKCQKNQLNLFWSHFSVFKSRRSIHVEQVGNSLVRMNGLHGVKDYIRSVNSSMQIYR